MARSLGITYGGFDLGESPYHLHLPVTIESGYSELRIVAQVVVEGTGLANLENREAALSAAFRKPRQDFSYTLGGVTRSYSESDWTGLGIRASSRKLPSEEFMGLAALHEITIEADLPADLAGEDYIVEAERTLSEDSSGRRTVLVSGVSTASAADNESARTKLASVVDAHVAAVVAEVDNTVTWEEIAATESWDKHDQRVRWTRSRRELLADQGTTTDVAAIRDDSLQVRIVSDIRENDPALGGQELDRADVNYSCSVKHQVTKDLVGLYQSEIRKTLIGRIRSAGGTGALAVVTESVTYDQTANTIVANLTVLIANATLIEAYTVGAYEAARGVNRVPVWSGDPHARALLASPGELVRSSTVAVLVVGDRTEALQAARDLIGAEWEPGSFGKSGSGVPDRAMTGPQAAQRGLGGSGGGWLRIGESIGGIRTKRLGQNAQALDVTAAVLTGVDDYVVPVTDPRTPTGFRPGSRVSSVAR